MSATGAGAAQGGIGAFQILDAKNSADAIKRQAAFQAQQNAFNAELIGFQKEDLKAQADTNVKLREKQVKQVIGSQKVALAAQGIEVNSELGLKLETDEREIAKQDIRAIKNNAWREALGLDIQQQNLSTQSQFAQLGGQVKARQTLTTGGLRGVSSIIGGARTIRS